MAPNDIALSYELTPHEIAEQLILNGFSPCPLEPMSKAIKIKDWTNKEFSPDQFKQANGVGIKTGKGLIAIDIDVYDPKISAEITKAAFQELGPTFARVGQAPKIALLYRSTAINSKITLPVQPTGEAPTKKTEAIEVLASGQQLVAAAIHPDTKRPYSWDGTTPWSPFTGHIEKLPLIDAANWQNFHSSISHLLVQESLTQHAAVKQSGTQNRSIGNDSPSVEEVQEILSYIPSTLDYDAWVIVTMGLKSLGEQYRTLWLNWSATGQTHDPYVDPAKWDQVSKDGSVTFKTVCHYAQQNGADLSAIARLHSNLNTGPNIVRSKVLETPTPLIRKFSPAGRYPINGAWTKGFAPQTYEVDANRPPLLEHVANIELTAPQYLIEGLFEQQSLCQMFGEPGSGKSFMAIDAACSIGSGKDFHGRTVVRGPVVYVAGEGRRGVVRRINAWAKAHSIDLADISLYVSRTAVGINNGNNLAELKAEIHDIMEEFGAPALIIVDTLARNFGDGDENDTKDMTSFIAEVDRLNDEFHCASLIVHHAGHGEKGRARGSSALKGALDTEYKISKQEDRIRMSCSKMKDDDEPEPMCFYLIPVDMGQDEAGAIINSAVLEFRGTGAPESARLTNNEQFAVKTFREAVGSLEASPLNLNPAALHLEQWREAFYKRSTQPNPDSKRKAFDRARRDLQSKGWITVEDDAYTLTPRTPGQSPDKQD